MLATVSLITITASLLIASLYHIYLTINIQKSANQRDEELYEDRLSIITPIKNEPIEIVEKYIKHFSQLTNMVKTPIECIIVADYTDNSMFNSILGLLSSANPGIVIVRRFNGVGGRNGAINDGVKLALGSVIAFIDIDAEPPQNVIASMAKCKNVCISWWRICDKGVSKVSKTIAFITEYGSWLYYWCKSLKNLFLYPLGSGTALKKNLLTSIGGLRIDVIQDDIWLGTQLIYRGIYPRIIESMCVDAPKTLDAFLIQQRRWGYGATDILKRFGIYILRSSTPVSARVEALTYVLQPLIAALGGFGLLLSIISAFTEVVKFDMLHTIFIALLVLSMILESITVNKFLKWSRDPLYDTPYIVGRASAILAILSIATLPYVLAALIGIKIPYKVTPKEKRKRGMPTTIKIIAVVFTTSLLASIVRGNTIATILTSLGTLASLYTLARLR